MDRPGFVSMLQEIEKGKAAAVFVKDLPRLGRNYIEVGRLTEGQRVQRAGQPPKYGRLPDSGATSFKRNPTFPNQDDGTDRFVYENAYTTLVYSNSWEDMARTPFREYEEGVYLGYR